MLDIWDCSSPLRPSVKINAHQAEILSCSWNQFYPFVLATGGAEGLIRIWDIRKLLTPIFQLEVGIDFRFYKWFFTTGNVANSSLLYRIDFWKCIRFNHFFFDSSTYRVARMQWNEFSVRLTTGPRWFRRHMIARQSIYTQKLHILFFLKTNTNNNIVNLWNKNKWNFTIIYAATLHVATYNTNIITIILIY